MKIHISLISIFILLLTSCLFDDDDTVSSSSSSSSLGSATINDATTAKEVFVNNFELKLNPTFTINGETAVYENSTTGDFPVASNESLKVVYSPVSTGLKVTFTFDSGAHDDIEIVMGSFIDVGNEGYIDEIEIVDVRVDVSNASPEGKKLTEFIGTQRLEKPLKRHDSDIAKNLGSDYKLPDQPKAQDFSGAPDVDEWNKNIVGKAFLIVGSDGDKSMIYLTSSTSGIEYGLTGSDSGNINNFTYVYVKDEEKKGTMFYKGEYYANANYDGKMTRWQADLDLQFTTDFFSGTWSEDQGMEVNEQGEKVWEDTSPGSGTFEAVTDVTLELKSYDLTAK